MSGDTLARPFGRQAFGLSPENYHLARPPYPPAVWDVLRQRAGLRSGLVTRAHHLIAAREILDRRAPDVHKAGKRKHQKNRHSQNQVNTINPFHPVKPASDVAPQRDHHLCPADLFHHARAVHISPNAQRKKKVHARA